MSTERISKISAQLIDKSSKVLYNYKTKYKEKDKMKQTAYLPDNNIMCRAVLSVSI